MTWQAICYDNSESEPQGLRAVSILKTHTNNSGFPGPTPIPQDLRLKLVPHLASTGAIDRVEIARGGQSVAHHGPLLFGWSLEDFLGNLWLPAQPILAKDFYSDGEVLAAFQE